MRPSETILSSIWGKIIRVNPFFKTLSAAALAIILTTCSGQKGNAPATPAASSSGNGTEKKEIVFGTTIDDFGGMVKNQIQPALEKRDYKVKLIEFIGYIRSNLALAESELDINVFQHKPCLDDSKKEHRLNIVEAFQVPTAPLGLYLGKLKSLDEVKDGVSVSVPSDPSSFTHALVMLDRLGWIKLKAGAGPLTASRTGTAENPKNIQVVELRAAQLPRSRADVDFAIVNGSYAMSSGMKLTETLFQKPSFAYVNWSAVRTADKNSQWLKDVTEAYNFDGFKAYSQKHFAGYKYPAARGENAAAGAQTETASTVSATK